MTVQEAIDVFEKPSDHIKTIQINHVTGIVYSADLVKAFEMAIEALEKQIPKKVDTTGSGDDDFYICPVCKERLASIDEFVLLEEPYCSNCGQKLDWGD